jgi:hypothetical protein
MHEPPQGCLHRINYSILVGLRVDMTFGTQDGPQFRLTPDGAIVFADEQKEQAFQDWYSIENGAIHSDPCELWAEWRHETGLPPS